MRLPVQLSDFLDVIPAVLQAPHRSMQCTYDEPADVIYMNFEPGHRSLSSPARGLTGCGTPVQ